MINYGEGVYLGPLVKRDLELYRHWRNRESIRSWCRQDDLIDERAQEDWYYRQSQDPRIRMYAIYSEDDDMPRGVCGLTDLDFLHRRAEFSLYIDPESQGRGYAKAALKTLFTWGFDNFNLNLIWGESFAGNPAIKIFESLGMMRDGERRDFYFVKGSFKSAYLYSIRASEWKNSFSSEEFAI